MLPGPREPRLAAAERPSLAWKTGTSFGFRDAWSIGVIGNHVLTVWVGNFDGSANPALVGREAAAPLFFAIADSLAAETGRNVWWAAGEDVERLPQHLNLKRVEVCATTMRAPCSGSSTTASSPAPPPERATSGSRVPADSRSA